MYRKRRAGSGKKGKLLAVLAVIVIAAVYYYVAIPAVNIHSSGFWMFLIALVVLGLLFYGGRKGIHSKEEVKSSKILKLGIGLVVVLVLVYFAGSILSSPIVNAKKYRNLMVPRILNRSATIRSRFWTRNLQRFWETVKWEVWWIWFLSLKSVIFILRLIIRDVRFV